MKWVVLPLAFLSLALASAESALSPRVRLRFDDNWRFRRDPLAQQAAGASAVKWQWKPATVLSVRQQVLPSNFVQGDWRAASLGQDVFREQPGFAWFRGDLGTGPKPPAPKLHFESVDDNAAVFVNGVLAVTHFGWDDAFDVPLAAWNAQGPNVVAVLVQNTGGQGGIYRSVTLEKPGAAVGIPKECQPSFNDRGWRVVHLPHDYVVEGQFTKGLDPGHGSLPVTTAWYRKSFTLPASWRDKSVWIDFDGVYRNSTVYLNGHRLGHWADGYSSFRYDLNRYARFGGENVLAVSVDPRKNEGWWYEGGGIYRHVWLNAASRIHVRPWGQFASSEVKLGPVASAELTIRTTVLNGEGKAGWVNIEHDLLDASGRRVATVRGKLSLAAHSTSEYSTTISLKRVALWSIEHPTLYSLRTSVSRAGKVEDAVAQPIGFRHIRFDADHGFFLNGKHVELQGTCNHQDHAGVGIAIPDGLFDWRIRRLKEMGSNAYRCSHNPPAAELLDACDRLGMVVMDETRHFGSAQGAKTSSGTGAEDLSELRSMVLRDRNHPSIIMWSLFNEEPLQGTAEGAQIFTKMRAAVRELDTTRPCTGAMNGGWGRGVTEVQDIQGFNYGIGGYDRMHANFPKLPMFGSETASAVATRGIYADDPDRGYVTAYDLRTPGSYAATAEQAWTAVGTRPWLAGAFVWTGFDYKGEPSPYGWPCINSHFGIMDMCGFPKDSFYYYQAWWGTKPMAHIVPHWNWPGKEGQPVKVWVYTNGDSVELFLNGRSLGTKAMPHLGHLEWDVPFSPGALHARAYRNGRLYATDTVSTTGQPAAIRLKTTRPLIVADDEDVSPIEVEILDSKGRVVPTADNLVRFSVEGDAHVVGVGNGDPSSHEPDKASQRRAFNGLCMALVGSSHGTGTIRVIATSPGLKSAYLVIQARR